MAAERWAPAGPRIPRNSLALLMVAQAAVVLPHVAQLSPWIIAVCLFCGYWRTRVYQGRWGYPSRLVRLGLVVAGTVGVVLSAGGSVNLELFIAMLVLAFAFKLVEMHTRRDAVLVIMLSYFIIATEFLFEQALFIAVYELVATILVTAAMVGLNQMHSQVRPFASIRLATGLVAQALPLAVVLFLFFPRLLPLWSMPLPGSARTGLTDAMTPGDVAELGRSDALAFRVEFDGVVPDYREMYWRALVYSDFRQGTWRTRQEIPEEPQLLRSGDRDVGYEVLLEPTAQQWLVSLDVPFRKDPRTMLTSDFRLRSETPVLSVLRYRAVSGLEQTRGLVLSEAMRQRETTLPVGDNPRMVAYARELLARTRSVEAFADALLSHIREQPYTYTLSPGELPKLNSVDAFWFDTRRGFCAHYAGAFTYAMRAAGIPARLVGGYLGGERNPLTGHWMVRQYDAHGWSEVWIADRGWVRFDPTAAVAPERIEQGPSEALRGEERAGLSLFSAARFNAGSLFGRLLLVMDSLEHRWNMFVVGYDQETQRSYLANLLGDLRPGRIALLMVGAGGVCFGLVAFVLFFRHRPAPQHPGVRLIDRFSRAGARAGWPRTPHESPQAYVRRLGGSTSLAPALVSTLAGDVEMLLYGGGEGDRALLRRVATGLRRLRLRLVLGGAT
ncbi:MAG: DUF3488 and transglutaminase-like domain-containing protein [Pseudomonadales bacterium]